LRCAGENLKVPVFISTEFVLRTNQHVRDGVKYPAVILTTGWNDPAVAPWQVGKMAARLQAATASGKPVLL
jgi:prolyl oligopeptidase